mmetsp:Transcript_10675/g.18861  ORF Transcript_10675/g.18861 Transcript_10675/m.18861 type:complete len:460 (-) Transcript_10675:46-1425(-)
MYLAMREIDPSWRRAQDREAALTRARSLTLCAHSDSDLFPSHSDSGGFSSLALDAHAEDRFLLAGRGNGQILLHDLWKEAPKSVVAKAGRKTPKRQGHKHVVSHLSWFGADNGLFVSASADTKVLVWDTGSFTPVCDFKLSASVYTTALSPVVGGATSALVACGTKSPFVRLCDLKSGSHTQLLQGHRSAVLSCAWSPVSEYVLATGSRDKSVRLWDLRKSGEKACFATLDQHNSRRSQASDPGANDLIQQSSVSAQDFAHDGAVSQLQFVMGGRFLLTSGTDARIKVWKIEGREREDEDTHSNTAAHASYRNTLIHFSTARHGIQLAPGGQMVVSEHSAPPDQLTVYHSMRSAGNSVGCFDVFSGEYLEHSHEMSNSGHFMRVTGLQFRETFQELYSCGLDGLLLRWTAKNSHFPQDQGNSDSDVRDSASLSDLEQNGEEMLDWTSDIDEDDDADFFL